MKLYYNYYILKILIQFISNFVVLSSPMKWIIAEHYIEQSKDTHDEFCLLKKHV